MCGIIGVISRKNVVPQLIKGLKHLEYRGYDSAGIGLVSEDHENDNVYTNATAGSVTDIKNEDKHNKNFNGNLNKILKIHCYKAVGKVQFLEDIVKNKNIQSQIGLAHTRWATHGKPEQKNAHPHISSYLAVVHNGIIENYQDIKILLQKEGYKFISDTDTEVIIHLLHKNMTIENDFIKSVSALTKILQGNYSLCFISAKDPDRLIAIKNGSPLVAGYGENCGVVASDTIAMLNHCNEYIYMQDGDIAEIKMDQVKIYDSNGKELKRHAETVKNTISIFAIDKQNYKHFMLKEIYEQPQAIANVFAERIYNNKILSGIFGYDEINVFRKIERIHIVGCGTSYYAGLIGKYLLDEIGIPAQVEISSEMRYRKFFPEKNTLFVTLSQSGETADTIAALRLAKTLGYLNTLAICNVTQSTLFRESDLQLLLKAGPEIGVASTKGFTAQIVALFLLVGRLAKINNKPKIEENIAQILSMVPDVIKKTLDLNSEIKNIASKLFRKKSILFVGRWIYYPIALEGALKMKELTYIHAEGYAAGELKHGPLALIDSRMPVIAIAPTNQFLNKIKSNLSEIKTRDGELFIFTDDKSEFAVTEKNVVNLPETNDITGIFAYTVALQLLAYHVAYLKGTDIDQPRNLAKSVTVE